MTSFQNHPSDPLDAFMASLPASYLNLFDSESVREHAEIAARRTSRVHLELWRSLPGELYVVCLVAEDRPGLLATVSSALTQAGLSIEGAQIFTRKSSPVYEAIDFFWVRPDAPSTAEDAVQRALQLLTPAEG